MASNSKFLSQPIELIGNLFRSSAETAPPAHFPTAPPTSVSGASSIANQMATTRLPTPSGLCGSVASENGSSDWVCHAFGQTMPGLVFFVSIVVMILTALFLIRYFSRCRQATKGLKALMASLEQDKLRTQSTTMHPDQAQQTFQKIRQAGAQLPALITFADHIENSVISVEGIDGQFLNRPLEEIAEKNNDLGAWTGKALADEIPTWLTTVGLLTTFIAILLGLQHVQVMSNMEVLGIDGLVNGLSGKFFSSIVALSCALSVTITNFFWSTRLDRLWGQILTRLELSLPHLKTEKLLLTLLANPGQKRPGP